MEKDAEASPAEPPTQDAPLLVPDVPNENISTSASPTLASDLHVIAGWTVCTNGLAQSQSRSRRRVPNDEIDIVKTFLTQCRRIKRLSLRDCSVASDLKHEFERLAGRYLSTGSVIVAALQMGISIAPLGNRNAIIGINIRDVKRLTKEVWSWS